MKTFQIPFIFLCIFSFQSVLGQNTIAVAASVDKNSIVVGEQAQLKLEAFFPSANQPSFFAIDSFPHFEILGQSKIDTLKTEGGVQLSQTLTLTSWDSGAWSIPPLALQNSNRLRTKA